MSAYPGSPVTAGSSNEAAVRLIQQRLADLRIPESSGMKRLVVDGAFGPATEEAVKLFQAQAVDPAGVPLDIDGAVGPMTWAALFGSRVATVKATGSPLLDAVLAVAQTQVGVREVPLNSNRGPQVDQYILAAGLDPKADSYAWCAAFLVWVFRQAAADIGQTSPLPKTAGVKAMWNKIGEKGLLRLSPREAGRNPELVKPGMLFFLDTGGITGHVGLVKSVQGVTLRTIEGNTTDKSGSREGIGVFERNARKIGQINLGFADVSRSF